MFQTTTRTNSTSLCSRLRNNLSPRVETTNFQQDLNKNFIIWNIDAGIQGSGFGQTEYIRLILRSIRKKSIKFLGDSLDRGEDLFPENL